MMREVIERRFSRLVKEHGTPEEPADAEATDTFLPGPTSF